GKPVQALHDQPVVGPAFEFHDGFKVAGRGDDVEGRDRRKLRRDEPEGRAGQFGGRERHQTNAMSSSVSGSKPASAALGAAKTPPRMPSRYRRTSISPSWVPAVTRRMGG